jgi:structural maintenance of chromosome 1
MDAISFVLGIKSSHLRSTHLRDLVYRGRVLKTSKINDDGSAVAPQANGHANGDDEQGAKVSSHKSDRNDPKSAWVMAVYEDDAGDDQKWKRSITSQGVSEYRINDRVVSASEYNDALEAENILIKARNFLVFQGDVEAIASQSPKDLTRLIEQISGSLEYKAEYERLEKEADEAAEIQNDKLHRRRGINSEIKQYQEQKKEADNFQAKAEERDNAIVQHILWKLFHFQKVMEESGAEIQRHQEELKEFRRGVEKYERNLNEARNNHSSAQRNVGKVEQRIKGKEKTIEDKENSLVPIDEKIEQLQRTAENVKKRAVEIKKERDDQAESIRKLKKELTTVEKASQLFEVEWEETMKKQGKALSTEDLREYNKLKTQVMSQTSKNQAKLDNLLRQLTTDQITVSNLKSKVEASQSQVEKYTEELQLITSRRDATKESLKQTSKEIESKKKEYNLAQSARLRVNQNRTELEEKIAKVVRDLADANDGRRQNAKEAATKDMVIQLKRHFPGVRGRIGELCKPKQKKFDEAVITALGRDFDSVVVDTEKTGQECVQYLKERRFGTMTFIPLDNIKVNAVNSSLKGLSKARLTIDTIDFDSSLERAMSYACGSSIVCDDLATARDICYKKGTQVKAVTLEGFVIHKAGLMTGGRGAEGKGKKRQFEDHDYANLEKIYAKLMAELDALPKANRRGTEEEILQSDLSGLEQQQAYKKSELAAFEQNLSSKKKQLDHEKRQLNEIKPKYDEQAAQLEVVSQNVEEFQDAVIVVENKVFSAFCQRLGYVDIREYEAQQGSLQQEAEEKRNDFLAQKQKLGNRLSWEIYRNEETEKRIKSLEDQLAVMVRDIQGYANEKSKLEKALDFENAELDTLNDQLNDLKDLATKTAEKVIEARNELQKRSKHVESTLRTIAGLEAEAQRAAAGRYALLRRCKLEQIRIPLAQGSRGLDSLPVDNMPDVDPDAMEVDDGDVVDPLMSGYGIEIDFDELDEDLRESSEEHTEEALLQKITTLNNTLEKLNPNMRALERLQTVEGRLRETEKEFDDSRVAAKTAREAFLAVKEKRFELFNKAFTHISEQISHVYRDLTRSAAVPLGGTAYLDIEDSDTPYLTGIKYHAVPPLKRFSHMDQLSGGEKTMAALALLFAVHSYQPSPFFVLDEVDAALDNANVEKVRNYIREHANPGMQFIVISLKTGLFVGSESLVGIYRDQDANSSNTLTLDVSTLVPHFIYLSGFFVSRSRG